MVRQHQLYILFSGFRWKSRRIFRKAIHLCAAWSLSQKSGYFFSWQYPQLETAKTVWCQNFKTV